ncbi:class I SAM-dependent methyltransferase [Bacillus sp. FJAT-50079]|uniref:class I SAM-dependent methyltransferase n=1 Tax=Bacillus sp. FJAT-50079 TaxID=2833577 RepID=UPI001BC95CAD|nr:class I SAM-dependent methyltransferase [Bacillus sp. FJAT-50079]MBS4210531.1 class I SAM-dependent methyltransferase [Bacillus sp. FJAT-50079]
MADHYYTRNPEVASEPTFWNAELRNHSLRFKTDQGVFSKKEVDFGSRFLIETFELPQVEGPVLDVGCGYGPIGISLAKSFPDRHFHMIDVNERALRLAKENATINQTDNVLIYESDRLLEVAEKKFAAIVTNPPIRAGKSIVHDIFEQSYNHLVANGELFVVIQKKQGAPSAKAKMEEIFGFAEVMGKRKGYYILRSIKR